MKCVYCQQKLSYSEYLAGYCPTSHNSFHHIIVLKKKVHPADAKIGAVGGE